MNRSGQTAKKRAAPRNCLDLIWAGQGTARELVGSSMIGNLCQYLRATVTVLAFGALCWPNGHMRSNSSNKDVI